MTRLRYNHCFSFLDADIDNSVTTFDLIGPLQEGGVNIPSVVAPDILVMSIETETIHVTDYTSGSSTITACLRGQEDTAEATHPVGARVYNTPTKVDFETPPSSFSIKVATASSTDADKAAADFLCTGTNDEVVFQYIIDTYGLGDELTVLAAPGNYSVSAQIDVDCPARFHLIGDLTVSGLNVGSVYFGKDSTGDFSIFECSTHSFFVGVMIESYINETITSAPLALGAGGSYRLTLRHCAVYSFTNSNIPAISTAAVATVVLEDCDIEGDGNGILFSTGNGASLVARHSLIYGDTDYSVEATDVANSADFLFDDCWLYGVRIDGNTAATPMPKVRVIDTHIDSSGATGIESLYLSDISRLDIQGGVITDTEASTAVRLNNVDEGIINGLTIQGIVDRHGIWLLDCEDVSIGDCSIEGYGRETDATYSGILLDGDTNRCAVRGNDLRHGYASGNMPLYGVRVDDSTCDDNVVENNNLLGSSKTNGNEFSDAGTGTRGWLTKELHYIAGAAAVQQYPHRIRFDRPAVLGFTYMNVGTAPVTTSLIGDVRKNGTAIYTTTGNRPTVAAAGNANTPTQVPDTKYVAANDYLNAEITQIGSGGAGSDVTILQRYMPI